MNKGRNQKAAKERQEAPVSKNYYTQERKSFDDILRKVKADPELIDLSGSVSHIRRTQKKDLILKLNKSSEKSASKQK